MVLPRKCCARMHREASTVRCAKQMTKSLNSARLIHVQAVKVPSSTQQTTLKTIDPLANGPPFNFSFSGSGFLISYHLGVAKSLMQMGLLHFNKDVHDVTTPSSKVAGGSGGSLTALALACDFDLEEMHDDVRRMVRLCHEHGTVWKLEKRLRDVFDQKRPQISLDKVNQRLSITTTQWLPTVQIVHHNQFDSIDDVIEACVASCWVPYYLAPTMTTMFRGHPHLDGTILRIVPEVPGYVKVCAFPAHVLRRPDYNISPSIDAKFPYSFVQLARFSLFPPSLAIQDEIFQLGQEAAAIWARQEQLIAPQKQVNGNTSG